MNAAVFGLVGVIVGGVLNGLVSYALERRKERRAAKTAARLLLDEWRAALFLVQDAMRLRRWQPDQPIRFEIWERHRELLANQLQQEAWLRVSNARLHVAWINTANAAGGKIDGETRKELDKRWRVVRDAIDSYLMPVAVHGPQRRRAAQMYWRLRARLRRSRRGDSNP